MNLLFHILFAQILETGIEKWRDKKVTRTQIKRLWETEKKSRREKEREKDGEIQTYSIQVDDNRILTTHSVLHTHTIDRNHLMYCAVFCIFFSVSFPSSVFWLSNSASESEWSYELRDVFAGIIKFQSFELIRSIWFDLLSLSRCFFFSLGNLLAWLGCNCFLSIPSSISHTQIKIESYKNCRVLSSIVWQTFSVSLHEVIFRNDNQKHTHTHKQAANCFEIFFTYAEIYISLYNVQPTSVCVCVCVVYFNSSNKF